MSRPPVLPFVIVGSALLLGGCDLGKKVTYQNGYRGAGIQQVVQPTLLKVAAAIPPEPYPMSPDEGDRAGKTYQNVQVLGYASTDDFNRIMLSMNAWIGAGEQGCNYCHNPENMASDEKYTKVVARRMLQMTQNINNNWTQHVHGTGVTCWTCHRGNAVPVYNWNLGPAPGDPLKLKGLKRNGDTPLAVVAYSDLPNKPFATYLNTNPAVIRVAANSPYPSRADTMPIANTRATYGLMMHMSSALGVNCTYCHNTQSFRQWSISRPQRANAWYGIRMVRDINVNYIGSLTHVFPAYRKGPQGDPNKVNCGTCHQAQAKPLNGYPMLSLYPVLKGPRSALKAAQPTPNTVAAPNGEDMNGPTAPPKVAAAKPVGTRPAMTAAAFVATR